MFLGDGDDETGGGFGPEVKGLGEPNLAVVKNEFRLHGISLRY
jgi:hypothetical protein